ncbi:uncharacterized protein LOC128391614 [Panonychus citri]|uniref:uncharacterized protein LOC128391614 n=1 Tax=Panonychus citri TaxID=50023 RepID=UPI0023075F51|nr:uncharacterized protein LOC128391614 [Panonychus citri]
MGRNVSTNGCILGVPISLTKSGLSHYMIDIDQLQLHLRNNVHKHSKFLTLAKFLPNKTARIISSTYFESTAIFLAPLLIPTLLNNHNSFDKINQFTDTLIIKYCNKTPRQRTLPSLGISQFTPTAFKVIQIGLKYILNRMDQNSYLFILLLNKFPNYLPTVPNNVIWSNAKLESRRLSKQYMDQMWLMKTDPTTRLISREWITSKERTKNNCTTRLLLGVYDFILTKEPCSCSSLYRDSIHLITTCPKYDHDREKIREEMERSKQQNILKFLFIHKNYHIDLFLSKINLNELNTKTNMINSPTPT